MFLSLGEEGTRLKPFTKYLNKHLLPIYDRFMVTFPIETLRSLGINEVCIVTGEKDYTDFKRFINDGREYAVKIEYRTQTRSKGLADAVYQTRDFFGDQKVIVILGDDVFSYINIPKNSLYDDYAYSVVVPAKGIGIAPHAVAVPEFDGLGNITRIDEKPEVPKSEFMVAGCLFKYFVKGFNLVPSPPASTAPLLLNLFMLLHSMMIKYLNI